VPHHNKHDEIQLFQPNKATNLVQFLSDNPENKINIEN